MKAIKIILSIIAILIGLYLILCAVFSKTFDANRSIVINAPAAKVFTHINNFNQWHDWNPWVEQDTAIKITVTGNEGEPGYKYEWVSENKNLGKGSLTRTATVANKSIDNDLVMVDFGMYSKNYWTLEETPEGTKVIWGDKGELPFLRRIMSPFMDGMLGRDFEHGLAKLKKVVEEQKDDVAAPPTLK